MFLKYEVIAFKIELPAKTAHEFIRKFGNHFAFTDPEGHKVPRSLRSIKFWKKICRIEGEINLDETKKLDAFMKKFCSQNKIAFFEIADTRIP